MGTQTQPRFSFMYQALNVYVSGYDESTYDISRYVATLVQNSFRSRFGAVASLWENGFRQRLGAENSTEFFSLFRSSVGGQSACGRR